MSAIHPVARTTALLLGAYSLLATTSAGTQEPSQYDCEGEDADTQWCIDQLNAFEQKARVDALLADALDVSSPPWDDDVFQSARADYEVGLEHYNEQVYGDAAEAFESVVGVLSQLLEHFNSTASQFEELALNHLENQQYEEALPHLDQLVEWFPNSPDLAEAKAQATTGIDLGARVRNIQQLIRAHQFDVASAELTTFPQGYWTSEVGAARKAIDNHRSTMAFNHLMTRGIHHVDNQRWPEALRSFQDALKIRPNSVAARESLDQAVSNVEHLALEMLVASISRLEVDEQWQEALLSISNAPQKLQDKIEVRSAKRRLEALTAIERELDHAIAIVMVPMNQQSRANVRRIIEKTADHATAKRIGEKRDQLRREFDRQTTPIRLTITSDSRTEVSIRPGRKLGTFDKKELDVYPGSFELTGVRRGFREVRQKVTVEPESEPLQVHIVCDDRF